MKRIVLAAALLIASLAAALAQGTVNRIGPITPGNCASFNSPNTIQDAGFPCPGAPGAAITALTGDGTATGPGSVPFLLATVTANVGVFGSATQCVIVTNNAKGLTTAISAVTCTPAFSSITGQATLAQLPTIGANTVLGSIAGGTPIALTQTQLTSLVNTFTASLPGLAPAFPNNTTTFLRGDGTYAAPTGGTFSGTITPQGRLTLTSATPVMTTSVAGATTVFYTPYAGCLVPIFNGSVMIPTCFAEVSQLTTDATKSPAAVAASSVYDIFCWIDTGPTNRCTRGPAWTNDTTRSLGITSTGLGACCFGIFVNSGAITNGPGAGFGTYVGSIRSDGSSQINYTFCGAGAGGIAGNFAVWNAYNRITVACTVTDSTSSWTYAVSDVWRAPNGNATMRVSAMRGLDEDAVIASYSAILGSITAGATALSGIGVNSTTTPSGTQPGVTTGSFVSLVAQYNNVIGLGYRFVSALEYNDTTNSSTWRGSLGGTAPITSGLNVTLRQ
jgi:hypothetical protein